MYPSHLLCPGLGAGNVQRGASGIDPDYPDSPAGEKAGEGSCPAADVQDSPGPEPFGQGSIGIKVRAIRIQQVINLSEAPLFEQRIGHRKIL